MTIKDYTPYTETLELHEIKEIQYVSNREVTIRSERPFSERANTHLMIPPIRYDNPRKSKKIGTLLLIGIISTCAAMTATVLPLPWSLITIGFGGPLITLIRRMFKE